MNNVIPFRKPRRLRVRSSGRKSVADHAVRMMQITGCAAIVMLIASFFLHSLLLYVGILMIAGLAFGVLAILTGVIVPLLLSRD